MKEEPLDSAPQTAASSLKRKHDDEISESDDRQAKVAKRSAGRRYTPVDATFRNSDILRTAQQIINELREIKPVEFKEVAAKGPAHKPQFVYNLRLSLSGKALDFTGMASSKGNARSIASINALIYLIESTELFKPLDKAYVRNCVDFDLKKLAAMDNAAAVDLFARAPAVPEQAPVLEQPPVRPVVEDATLSSRINDMSFEEASPSDSSLPQTLVSKLKSLAQFGFLSVVKLNEMIATNNVHVVLNYLVPSSNCYEFEVVSDFGPSHRKTFQIELKLKKSFMNSPAFAPNEALKVFAKETDECFVFAASGSNKKVAKQRACVILLEYMFGIKLSESAISSAFDSSASLDSLADSTVEARRFVNSMAEMVKAKYRQVCSANETGAPNDEAPDENGTSLRHVYAAIVQSHELDVESMKLVCLTTGTKCIAGDFMSLNGLTINDSHAEILSIRLLRKYLYMKLDEFIENPALADSIFHAGGSEASTEGQVALKSSVNFHLYISTSPCGDGRIFCAQEASDSIDKHPSRKVRGLLRSKIESGEGTIPVNKMECCIQSWDGILGGERLRVMSCSDKLCKYNTVGIQGALLSHFIAPVYLKSMVIGNSFSQSHMERAIYGRIQKNLSPMPRGYQQAQPILSPIINTDARQVNKASSKALLWSEDVLNNNVEVIETKKGRLINSQSPSSICKRQMFQTWQSTLNAFLRSPQLKPASQRLADLIFNSKEQQQADHYPQLIYNEVKRLAKDYQEAKTKVYEAFQEAGLGEWIRMPFEQNLFTLASLE